MHSFLNFVPIHLLNACLAETNIKDFFSQLNISHLIVGLHQGEPDELNQGEPGNLEIRQIQPSFNQYYGRKIKKSELRNSTK